MRLFSLYLVAMIYFRTKGNCSSLARSVQGQNKHVTYESFTDLLSKDWSGQKRLQSMLKNTELVGGYLIIDSTDIVHSYAQELEGAYWYRACDNSKSKRRKKYAYGYEAVLMIWTDGKVRIPIGVRLHKKNGPTKIDLALELLSFARNRLKLKPQMVLFDSWFAARVILQRIHDYGWYFVTRLKKNRNFDGCQLQRQGLYRWGQIGYLYGDIKVKVIKNGNGYLGTNRLSLEHSEIKKLYKIRPQIEESNRCLKQECYLESCQVRNIRAQENHLWMSIFAYLIIERERAKLGLTFYKLKESLVLRRTRLSMPVKHYL